MLEAERAAEVQRIAIQGVIARVLPFLPLAGAFLAAVVMYFPALDSGFMGDDYVYVYSVRSIDATEYVRDVVVPGSHSDTLVFIPDYWRPLYFLSFQATWRLFGDNVEGYHALNLAVHLANVALVWLLARRLGTTPWAAGFGAALFAVHPAAVDAVTWISSFNTVGFTFALGAMLLFMSAVRATGSRAVAFHVLSALLLAVGLLFRETAVAIFGLAAAWYLLAERRDRLFDWRTWAAFIPFAAVSVVYLLVRTRGFSIPASNPDVGAAAGWHVVEHTWYYVKVAALPAPSPDSSALDALQRVLGAFLVACVPLALLTRRWLIAACLIGLILSAVPASTVRFGVGGRLFYITGAVLGVTVAVVADEFVRLPRLREFARPVLAGATAVVLLVATPYGAYRVDAWVESHPEVHEEWVEQFREQYPALPPGANVYTAAAPPPLDLFEGFVIEPTVRYYYPDVGEVRNFNLLDPDDHPVLGPGDVIFIYGFEGP